MELKAWAQRLLAGLMGTLLVAVLVMGLSEPGNAVPSTNPLGLSAGEPIQRFIVGYRVAQPRAIAPSTALTPSVSSAAASAASVNGRGIRAWVLRRLALGNTFVVKTSRRMDQREAIAFMRALSRDRNVAYVELDRINRPSLVPNDPHYAAYQWHFSSPTVGLNLVPAWDRSTGAGVVVAVLDTGITMHADLAANVLPGYDFISDPDKARDGDGRDASALDEGDWASMGECSDGKPEKDEQSSWHGTHVAGTIAAVTNNRMGVASVAFGSKVVPVRVLGKCGGWSSDIIDGIAWASGGSVPGIPANPNPAEVINMSLGGSGSCGNAYQAAIDAAVARGSTVVVAAGNSNVDTSGERPANCQNVVAVGATNRDGGKATYSNFGSSVDVSAPGGQGSTGCESYVVSTWNAGKTTRGADTYGCMAGTSMAAPHVSGLVALMQSLAPSPLSPAAVEGILKSTARPFPIPPPQAMGSGIADATRALQAVVSNAAPAASFGAVANKLQVRFTDASTDSDGVIVSWRWEFGDGGTSAMANPLWTYQAAGTYNVRLTVTDNGGATATTVRAITVVANQPPTAAFTAVVSGMTLHLTDTSGDGDGVVVSRAWDFGNGQTSGSRNPVVDYAMPGDYTVRLSVTDDDGAVATTEQRITVVGQLARGVAAGGLQGSPAGVVRYTLEVPAGASSLSFTTYGGGGDADLYVKYGAPPTSDQYDCRSLNTGNGEACLFAQPLAGTYHVMLQANLQGFSGLELLADFSTVDGRQAYVNDSDQVIRDFATAQSEIRVTGRTGNGPGDALVAVTILHDFAGDLQIDLVAPDGTAYRLHDRYGESLSHVFGTYRVNVSSEILNGAWRLRVIDDKQGDIGKIDRWSIEF